MDKFRCTGSNCESCVLPDCMRPTVNLYGIVNFVFMAGKWRNAAGRYVIKNINKNNKCIKVTRPDGTVYYKSLRKLEYDRQYQRERYHRLKEARQ